MPVYEYRCNRCGHRFECLAKVDDPNPPCPHKQDDETCGGETEKLISQTSFALKGGGWASDGYS